MRVGTGGIRFLSADDAHKGLSGELPNGLLAQHELASRFLHLRNRSAGGVTDAGFHDRTGLRQPPARDLPGESARHDIITFVDRCLGRGPS